MRKPRLGSILVVLALWAGARPARGTSVIPLHDADLYARAQVIVHGVVFSSDVTVDELGRPETLSVIEPLEVLKGNLSGSLFLHQLGGELPDGRFFKMWGRPEYVPGREVIVFAIARPQGEYETAEMMLGKFEVWVDEAGNRFAVPDLAIGVHPGVDVHSLPPGVEATDAATLEEAVGARRLDSFLSALQRGVFTENLVAKPAGKLLPVEHEEKKSPGGVPLWGNINNVLFRYTNNATEVWTLNGTANITGGGTAEATAALASWTNDPNTNINYTLGSGTGNVIYLNATSSALGCGWSSCLAGAGVIGCGGPSGAGTNSWRGDSYYTIVGGTVELRAYCSLNEYDSITTQAVLTHELGHTLGLGHPDQVVSPHDVCRGDENLAQMRSIVQHRTTLGTDDQDAIRWLYGDGGNSCTSLPAPTVSSIGPLSGSAAGGTAVAIGGTNFVAGAAVSIGGAAATVTGVTATTISATTGPGSVGKADIVVTNPDNQRSTLTAGFFYDFVDVPASSGFHDFVVKLFLDGVAAGCGSNGFCPMSSVTRAQMSVFLLRSEHGSAYVPPAATGTVFADVAANSFAAAWIERLYAEGITAGCATSPLRYCPATSVTRDQMAIFLLKGEHGSAYVPPAATGVFSDVPVSSAFAPWIERLYTEGITGGCGVSPLRYCPGAPATREQMAVFLVTTFHLP